MSLQTLNRAEFGTGGLNGTDMAQAAASVAQVSAAALRAGKQWNGWARGGLIALSALGGTTAAAVTAVSAFVGYKVVRSARRTIFEDFELPDGVTSANLPAREKVTFKSVDGRLNLCGYYYRSPGASASLVMCHGFHGGAVDTHKPARLAQACGYNTLTLDFRGCGESEGRTTSVGFWEVNDLLGAVGYLKTRPEVDSERIGAYGFSMGGAVAMMAAARSNDIKVIVTDASFASLDSLLSVNFSFFYRLPRFPFRHTAVWWSRAFSNTTGKRVDPVEALKKMTGEGRRLPHLIIHGQQDPCIPVAAAHQLYQYSPGPKQLWLDDDAGHVVGSYLDSSAYMQRVCSFLDPILKR